MTHLKILIQLEEIQQNLNAVREHCRNRNMEKAMATESFRAKEHIEKSIQKIPSSSNVLNFGSEGDK